MATKPRARRKASALAGNPAAKLIEALKFVSEAQSKVGPQINQYCLMRNNWLVASNGILTIGTKIEEDLDVCPHTLQFLDALTKATEEQTIAQESPEVLSVSSGVFRALVSCVDPATLQIAAPDPQCAVIGQSVADALLATQVLSTDGAAKEYLAAVLLQSGSAVGTNGAALLEYWHGFDLPPNLLIPKKSAQVIGKAGKVPTGFGFSQSSATFWFEDGSFIKTQLFKGQYPNFDHLLNVETNPYPLPDGFFTALRAVESFNERGLVYFVKGVMSSNSQETRATTYKIEGLTEDMGFDSKYFFMLESHFIKAHFMPESMKVYFFGENSRGIIMGLNMKEVRVEVERSKTGFDDMDDDIPF